ncbi:MAG TPA: GNAT family N-acetyltransferase, partial [Actinomycetota bacterium]
AGVDLRALSSLEDFDAAIEVMAATWGPYQLLPREVITALAHSGNVPWGAFDGDRMIGFVLGWAGVDEDGLHVHSHMLAALPDRRHRGVGYALKLAQRAQALEQGIVMARWTFDPLVARNAWLNLGKLGAVADRFGREFYGEMTDDLNRGDRADRLVVRWDLEREPGPRPAADGTTPALLVAAGDPERPEPQRAGDPEPAGATIEVPRDHPGLRALDPALGARWRDAVAEALEASLAAGLIVSGFDRDRSAYVLTPRGSA